MARSENRTVTVGLPVYNGAGYLPTALSSLLAQDYPDIRILVCDNASEDDSVAICEAAAQQDARVVLHRNDTNIGAAGNFNLTAELSSTPYFMWANHDDVWESDYVTRCVAALEADDIAVLAYSRSHKIDDDGTSVADLMADLALDDPQAVNRLRRFHDWFIHCDEEGLWSDSQIEGLWIPVYGVMRTDALHRTALIGPYISSDTILLEELLLHGAFVEVPSRLFGKRDHEDRSMRDSRAYARRLAWFTGRAPGRFLFPKWRMLRGRLAAIRRSPVTGRERLACLGEMLAFYVRRPHEAKSLVKEILINLALAPWPGEPPEGVRKRLPEVW